MAHDHAGHDHGIAEAPERSLRWALMITGSFMVAEAIGGWLTNSLALLSDAAHMLTDTAALAIALAAIHVSKRAADHRRTFGYARFEILAAAFNAVVLFFVAIYILWEAIERFRHPPDVDSGPMMAVAAFGLVANLLSMRILSAGKNSSLNMKSAYLEVWSDMLGSVGVLGAGAIIYFTGWKPIDPIIAVIIGLWVLPRTWTILKQSTNILLEGVPDGMDTKAIETRILAIDGVHSIHDLHVWGVGSNKALLTAHVGRNDSADTTDDQVLINIRQLLKDDFHISHSTIQIERQDCERLGCQDDNAH